MAHINGKPVESADGKTIAEYLASAEYRTEYVAVEYNGNILKKTDFDKTVISSDDTIEVVSFVGGG